MALQRMYKYRSLQNYKWLIDIIINQRFHCAKFFELNDPMEGVFLYTGDALSEMTLDRLRTEKNEYKVCSFSSKPEEFLMWSHYADSHRGIVLGVDIDDNRYDVHQVQYKPSEDFQIAITDQNAFSTLDLLTRKLDFWGYEDEVRVLIRPQSPKHSQFVKFRLREVIFGKRMPGKEKTRVKKIINRFNPDVQFRESDIQRRLLGQI